ncbi:MAG TPA: BON domain-containing protein [Edaphobacter sp.]
MLITSSMAVAQQGAIPDAQVESNVLKALAGVPELADQAIGTTTVYGTVTITGSVASEELRDKAEQTIARTAGVKKVVDELAIGTPGTASAEQPQPVIDSNAGGAGPDGNMAADQSQSPSVDPLASHESSVTGPQMQQPPYPQQGQYPQQQPNYPQPQARPYRAQQAGQPVTLPVGTVLRVRINQAMDSRHTQVGAAFDGVVLNDIYMGGEVAVPRGAAVLGQVIETHPGGDLRGRGVLSLQLTQMTLEGQPYPLATEPWQQQGYDKTGQTVGTTVGLGAVGAMIGAIAGGGPGALLGAGIGGVAGLGLSSASHQGEAGMPSEAILNFRLTQQVSLLTVSQNELDRLAATMPPTQPAGQPQMRRRYPPPPPPYAYGSPYPYPYPYYYPYR